MRSLQTVLCGAIAALIVASSIALSGSRASAAPSRASVTVSLTGWASTPAEPKNLRKVLASFQKAYPNINVNYQVINGDLKTQIKTRLTAGTAPDVFYMDEGWAQEFAASGQVMPLNKYYKNDKAFDVGDFYKGLVGGFTYKKQVYGFPKDYSTLGMWYNTDMFKAAGISKPPTTWAQLESDACKLTNKSKNIYGVSLSGDAARWLAFEQAAGGPSIVNKAGTKASVDTPASHTSLDFYAGLVKKGCATDPASVGAGWNGEAFGKGNAAIAFEGNWLTSPMHDTYPGIHWGLATLPKGPKTYGNLAFSVAYAMWAKSKHPKEAWTLIRYLTGKAGMAQWVKLGGYLPGRKSIKPPAGTGAFVKGAKYARPWAFPEGFFKALDGISKDILKAMKGDMTVNDALADMQKQADAGLSGAP